MSTKMKDLTGMRFGKLTVLGRDMDAPKDHGVFWMCRCDCGNIKSIRGDSLRRGKTKSCGKTNKCSERKPKPVIDLTGQKFGKLTALYIDPEQPRSKSKQARWICACDCGNTISVPAFDLKSGNTKSCGCLRRSSGEELIFTTLKEHEIKFKTEYTFSDLRGDGGGCLKFDFYLPDLRTCIEYDGKQHYMPIDMFGGEDGYKKLKHHDRLKDVYCKSNNIKLFRIPFWKDDEIIITMVEKIIENIQESRNDHSLGGNDQAYADNSPTLVS